MKLDNLKSGWYHYKLKLSGNKKAKAKLKIRKKKLSGIWKKLVERELKNRRTHKGKFGIKVKGIIGQRTNGTRKVKFNISKKLVLDRLIIDFKFIKDS